MNKKKLQKEEILHSNQYYIAHRDGMDWSFEEKLFNEVKELNYGGLIRKRIAKNGGLEVFKYFWETESSFSQWHKSNFTGSIYSIINKELLPEAYTKELEFSSVEQFMMYNKAMLFADWKTAAKIMDTNNSRTQKELGRTVENFDDKIWKHVRCEIVLRGNRFKFDQNEALKLQLLKTDGYTLVEASPFDKIWGVGLKEDDERILKRKNWKGLNLLGEILTELREEILRK